MFSFVQTLLLSRKVAFFPPTYKPVDDLISLITFPKSRIVYTLCNSSSEYQSLDNGASIELFSYRGTVLISPTSWANFTSLSLTLLHTSRIVDSRSYELDDLDFCAIGFSIGSAIFEKKFRIVLSKRRTWLGLTKTKLIGSVRASCRIGESFRATYSETEKRAARPVRESRKLFSRESLSLYSRY